MNNLTVKKIVQSAKIELSGLIGREVESVSAVHKGENDTWKMAVETIEMKCVPDSGDLLCSYEATLDGQGNVIEYRRTRSYLRKEVGEI